MIPRTPWLRAPHPRAGLLLHNGLHTGTSEPIPKAMFDAGAVAHRCKR